MNKIRLPILMSIALASVLVLTATAGAATLTVTNTADSGPGSFREATEVAMSGDTINFDIPSTDPNCTGSSCVITLTTGNIFLDKDLTVNGPGARHLEIRHSQSFQLVFSIFNNLQAISVRLNGITISGGYIGVGFGSPGGTLSLSGVTVRDNLVGIYGIAGTINIDRSTINHNINPDPSTIPPCGGIYTADSLNVTNSTISDNLGQYAGGILSVGNSVSITNSTISGNTALLSLFGGGGIGQFGHALYLRNTIVAGNSAEAAPDIFRYGPAVSYGNNLIGNNTSSAAEFPDGAPNSNGDYVGVSALLGPLQNNGGETDTHSLLDGSPAINNGNNCVTDLTCAVGNPFAALLTDQRGQGFVRKFETVDIGAYEVQVQAPPSISPADMIEDLIKMIRAYDPRLPHGIETALIAKLNDALAKLAAGGVAGARSSLESFINQVRAQTGKSISPERATQLTEAANAIIAALN